DDLWVTVGSTNFDTRSFSTNDEANLNVLDPAFALAQRRIFEADLRRSRRITLDEWRGRPWARNAPDTRVGPPRPQPLAFHPAQRRIFEADLRRSRRITLDEWRGRPWTRKALDTVMDLLSSQL